MLPASTQGHILFFGCVLPEAAAGAPGTAPPGGGGGVCGNAPWAGACAVTVDPATTGEPVGAG